MNMKQCGYTGNTNALPNGDHRKRNRADYKTAKKTRRYKEVIIYDGETERLFYACQTRKKITMSFDSETDFVINNSFACEIVEQTPFKVILMIAKKNSSRAIADLALYYSPADISAEEEDIGTVVERIYGGSI